MFLGSEQNPHHYSETGEQYISIVRLSITEGVQRGFCWFLSSGLGLSRDFTAHRILSVSPKTSQYYYY